MRTGIVVQCRSLAKSICDEIYCNGFEPMNTVYFQNLSLNVIRHFQIKLLFLQNPPTLASYHIYFMILKARDIKKRLF